MEDSMPHAYRILFLMAETGAGHRSAAEAIRSAIHLLTATPGQHGELDADDAVAQAHMSCAYHTENIDAFAACGRFPLRKIGRLYGWSIRYTPRLYGALFHLTNHRRSFALLERALYRLLRRGLAQLLRQTRPDMIVCVHPLLSHAALRALDEAGLRIPFLTVMTDPVTPHRSWVAPAADHCIVPTDMARDFCQQHGMPDDNIAVLGMPIDLKFSRPCASKALLRKQLGLHPTMPVVLVMGGGEGAGKLVQRVRALWRAALPVQLVIVTGRNERLRRRLEQMARELPVPLQQRQHILGFAQNMHELMQAADLIVTKAGPGTISEAMACRLPIVLSGCIPGQEEGNVRYVCDEGIGVLAETEEELVAILQECFQRDAVMLEQMRANMSRLQKPFAALAIAEFILRASSPHYSQVASRERVVVA
jgi:1,2-diacylglycerol 3-beta-galactosyltransferase